MYDKKFYILLNYVLADEGGYSNDSDDKGSETNLGITQTALNEYTNSKIKFKKHSNNYGEYWVTINGNHVLINS